MPVGRLPTPLVPRERSLVTSQSNDGPEEP